MKLYFIALVTFLFIDMVWLGFIAKDLYIQQIGFLMTSDVNWIAAGIFYLLFIGGLIIFVILPSVKKSSWTHALLFGALFGLVTYATYDLTNLALTKNWPLLVSIIDIIWGAVLCSIVSVITYFVHKRFF